MRERKSSSPGEKQQTHHNHFFLNFPKLAIGKLKNVLDKTRRDHDETVGTSTQRISELLIMHHETRRDRDIIVGTSTQRISELLNMHHQSIQAGDEERQQKVSF